jgi:hypothetical protein
VNDPGRQINELDPDARLEKRTLVPLQTPDIERPVLLATNDPEQTIGMSVFSASDRGLPVPVYHLISGHVLTETDTFSRPRSECPDARACLADS